MEVKGRFDHFNFNVLDLDRSIRFYEKALGLKEEHAYRDETPLPLDHRVPCDPSTKLTPTENQSSLLPYTLK